MPDLQQDASADPCAVTLALTDLAAGKSVILTQEGPLGRRGAVVMAAALVDARAVSFMAVQARGLVCLTLPPTRVERLGIAMQPQSNREGAPVFTVSIEAREGVSTGISAADRARTIQVAVAPDADPDGIATPGHVFPMVAAQGGVLARRGQPEAAADLARLAGLGPYAVVCDVLDASGEVATAACLEGFARQHGLTAVAIEELEAYRHQHDPLVRETYRGDVDLLGGGRWTLRQFEDDATGRRHSVLTLGAVELRKQTPVFICHDPSPPDRPGLLSNRDCAKAVAQIRQARSGAILLLDATEPAQQADSALAVSLLRRIGVTRPVGLDLDRSEQARTAPDRHMPDLQMIDGGWR